MKKKILSIILIFVLLAGYVLPVYADSFESVVSEEGLALAAETYLWPVPGHTTLSGRFGAGHDGLDISDGSINGANIVATKSGTVLYWWNDCRHSNMGYQGCHCSYTGKTSNGFGNGMVIKHNDGTLSSYAHMQYDSIPMQYRAIGANVGRGAVIGRVGSAGWSTGPHLHFTICSGGQQYWNNQINNNPGVINYDYSNNPSAAITYSDLHTTFVDGWNAGLYGKINNPDRAVVSQVGAYVWDSAGRLVVNHIENCGLSNSTINQTLNIVGEALASGLKGGESYTYQLFANVNGQTFKSGVGSFKTTGGDTVKPVISEVEIRDLSSSGYTVVCKATDNIGVTKVQFPSWSTQNGQDDIIWGTGKKSGNTYLYRVNISKHKGNRGSYQTHIYAYDAAGNSAVYKINNIYVSTVKYRNIPNGVYELVNITSNSKVLDIEGAAKANYAKTILWDRNGNKNQKFRISYYGSGYYRIVAEHSGKSLDVNGGSSKSGTTLQQYNWNRSKAQLFRFEPAGNGYYYIRSKTGTYIDLKGGKPENGTRVWMYKCNRGKAQKWKLVHNYN